MTYRIVFAKRFQSDGNESPLDPTSELDVYLPDGVVADKTFVERFEPEAKHSQEVLDEDDAFLAVAAPEVWEYEVVDDRAKEFEEAIANAQTVMEFEVIDETPTDETDMPSSRSVPLGDGDTRAAAGDPTADPGDGPGAQATADPSAGGFTPSGHQYGKLGDAEGLDEMTILRAEDPRLGLTNIGNKPAEDWAANTGPDHIPDRGIASDSNLDDASTLGPDKPRS